MTSGSDKETKLLNEHAEILAEKGDVVAMKFALEVEKKHGIRISEVKSPRQLAED